MSEIPGKLRSAREAAGFTAQEIAFITKIKLQFIRAIEAGAFDQLPGEFFARAFIRMYAAEVGLSPDEIISEFDAERTPAIEKFEPDVSPVSVPHLPEWRSMAMPRALSMVRTSNARPVAALALALIAAIYLLNRAAPDGGTNGAVGTSGVAEAAPAPQPAQTPSPAPEREAVPEKLNVDIRPTADTWLTVTSDDRRLFSRLVAAGEHVAVEGHRQLAFRVGNAGGFEYAINGVPGRLLGAPGEVKDVQITPENYRTFRR